MPTKKSTATEKDTKGRAIDRFQKLAALALNEDGDEPSEEARTAAWKAITMLAAKDGELLVIPRAELEALKKKIGDGAGELAQVQAAQQKGMWMGGLLGYFLGKGGLRG